MPLTRRNALLSLFALPLVASVDAQEVTVTVKQENAIPLAPAPPREFRGVWVATVANIDWPSKPGLPVDQQQAELLAILDKSVQMHLNAVVFQVRPACDALYASPFEPWSEYLTGQQGKAPSPLYDPLEFAVTEAHKRGLELHAWFNPYRARHDESKSPTAEDHISKKRPELVRKYAKYLWLDPGEPEVQAYTAQVVLDVVKRYDIDGVHIDDYFYPYREKDASKKEIPFPDDASYQKYSQGGGALERDDWRRENVNILIERLYTAIKQEKPWVKFGISPFGIWRPGNPAQIKGFDAYVQIYADSRKWLQQGWCDYFTPQLYWKIEQTPQSYPVLLNWWITQNTQARHIWPGNYTSRVADHSKAPWPLHEIVYQVKTTRGHAGATGNVHFSMKAFLKNQGGISEGLAKSVYALPALVPASPWLGEAKLGRPEIMRLDDATTGGSVLTLKPFGDDKVWLWCIQTFANGVWNTQVVPGAQDAFALSASKAARLPDAFAISEIDRLGNQGPVVTIPLKSI
jgi:uncharacterized lipoprotein YddW (UPF0748 family)